MTDQLSTELIKRIFQNIGLTESGAFGVYQYKIKRIIPISIGDEEPVLVPVYSAQTKIGQSTYRLMVAKLSTNEHVMLFKFDKDTFGFYMGDFVFAAKKFDTWQPLNMLYKLNLATAFEVLTSVGYQWEQDDDEFFDEFSGFIEQFL